MPDIFISGLGFFGMSLVWTHTTSHKGWHRTVGDRSRSMTKKCRMWDLMVLGQRKAPLMLNRMWDLMVLAPQ